MDAVHAGVLSQPFVGEEEWEQKGVTTRSCAP